MTKKFSELWPYLALAVLIGGVLIFGTAYGPRGKTERTASDGFSGSALSIVENSFDFGTISMVRGKVEHEFILKNDGGEAVTVTGILTSCMCTNAYLDLGNGESYGPFGMSGHGAGRSVAATIKPGASAKLRAIFDPAAHGPAGVGVIQRQIYLETNSATSPRLELKFHAVVTL